MSKDHFKYFCRKSCMKRGFVMWLFVLSFLNNHIKLFLIIHPQTMNKIFKPYESWILYCLKVLKVVTYVKNSTSKSILTCVLKRIL